MKKKLFSVILCVILAGVFGGCSGGSGSVTTGTETTTPVTTEASGTDDVAGSMEGISVEIGTSGLFGPFSYYDTDGTTLIGYDVDMINALQEILGFDIEGGVQAMEYAALTTSIAEGKLDLGAAALCATDERKEVMDFSQTYCDSGQMVMVNKDGGTGITGVEDLAGKKVAVEKGTASHLYAENNLPDTEIEVHNAITTAYESLEQQKVDALIQDGPGCAFYIKTTESTKLEMVGDEFNQGQAPYAIAYNKDFQYQEQFNAALKILEENGTLEELYNKWCQ